MTPNIFQRGLPGIQPDQIINEPRTGLESMHITYGLTPGNICGECMHCSPRPYYTCSLTTGQYAGCRWEVGWNACGKFSPARKLEGRA